MRHILRRNTSCCLHVNAKCKLHHVYNLAWVLSRSSKQRGWAKDCQKDQQDLASYTGYSKVVGSEQIEQSLLFTG